MGIGNRWSARKLSSSAWFYVACSCCTGVYEERQARKRAKESLTSLDGSGSSISGDISRRNSTSGSSSSATEDIELGQIGGGQQYMTVRKDSESTVIEMMSERKPDDLVASELTMWKDSCIPLERLKVNKRGRILLCLLNACGWVQPFPALHFYIMIRFALASCHF